MAFSWDTQTGVNLILCIAIVGVGYLAWQRTRSLLILLVAVAFALFGVTHVASLLSLSDDLETPLIVIRIAGYALVALAVLMEARRKKPEVPTKE